MIDNINPNSQFHPYQPMDATPVADVQPSGLGGMLKKIGIDNPVLDSVNKDVRQSVAKARSFARANPVMVLGALAALAVGIGLIRRR